MGETSTINTVIMEEREETMVSLLGSDPFLRTAHFLNPTISNDVLLPLSPLSKFTTCDSRETMLEVVFKGSPWPQKNWGNWINKLLPKYESIWRSSRIYNSILTFTLHISKNNYMIVALGERWNADTNTFLFPWGESTITLEDMVFLGGYAVLGESILKPHLSEEQLKIKEDLIRIYASITRTNGHYVTHCDWLKFFINRCEDQLEHIAFLALWLSRYVFPPRYPCVGKRVFDVAICLSNGTPLALAPAVLARYQITFTLK